jgi:hypothetical protein
MFQTAIEYLIKIDDLVTIPTAEGDENVSLSVQQKFRLVMSEGQTFREQGSRRKDFYHAVIEKANKVCSLGVLSVFINVTLYDLDSDRE